jgi:hypothetical protein
MRTEIVISETQPRGDLSEGLSQLLARDGEHVAYKPTMAENSWRWHAHS